MPLHGAVMLQGLNNEVCMYMHLLLLLAIIAIAKWVAIATCLDELKSHSAFSAKLLESQASSWTLATVGN